MNYATGMPGWTCGGYGNPANATGWGWGQASQNAPVDYNSQNELAALRQEARALRASLEAINKRIDELKQSGDQQ
jgi:hypothetical protein